ncbi:transglycosylase SLT domain-containing protein [Bacillus sp. FJAT-49736]|uniref:transglycosylase SLT domain-containing protein n=1 Tax=Bacillus sp. FJAT-49736 TaxID=2833582 RepID=UPI001BC9E9FD|nr:transglycosylase SLT domain-containing protein [Bacillus sp. FJAT-49736]MBS4174343.1 transglycosylase SLT domain-containing protein [Bacillus sp. FJAT-49736]
MKLIRIALIMASVLLFSTVGHHYTEAASKTDSLVASAVKAAKVLSNATTVENKATGKNIPTKEYNDAKKKYNTALAAVKKQTGKQKSTNLSKLKDVKTKIDRGKKYIDAVTYGKKLLAKKATLDKYVKTGIMDTNTINAYTSLSSTLKSYAPKFTAVYGKKTQDKIKSLYKTPVDKVLSDLQYPVTVKQALNETNKLVKASAAPSKIADSYKKIVFNIDLIKQANYQKQLYSELHQLNEGIPENLNTGNLSNLMTIEAQFEQLDGLVSKGKSDEKVPGIYQSLKTGIADFNSSADQALLNKRFTRIMDQLKVSTSELKGMLTSAAVAKGVPPEIVKAIAVTENSKLQQFLTNGEVFKSDDNGYGIMQVTPTSEDDQRFNWDRVKYDLRYNIEVGIDILLEKWNYAFLTKPIIPTINKGEKNVLENWYFAIMAYNGLSFKNDPNKNSKAYQLKVYSNLKDRTMMEPEVMKGVVMTLDPITQLPSFQQKMSYSTKKRTLSTQLYKKDKQITLSAKANFRKVPSTVNNTPKSFPAGTKVTLLSGPIEDNSSANLFAWYKVSIKGTTGTWYLASSNLQ